MGITSYIFDDHLREDFRLAHLATELTAADNGETLGNGPRLLDVIGTNISLDDEILDLDGVFN